MALYLLLSIAMFFAFTSLSLSSQPIHDFTSELQQINLKIAHLGNNNTHLHFFYPNLFKFIIHHYRNISKSNSAILWDNSITESVLEENNLKLKERELYLEECEKRMNEMSEKIHHLQSTLSTMKVCLSLVRILSATYLFPLIETSTLHLTSLSCC